MMQSPAHPGGSASASFLVLIEEDQGKRPSRSRLSAAEGATGTAVNASSAAAASSSPASLLHVPEFDWVQIRETRGVLRLYRHAPLDHYGSGGSGDSRRRGPPQLSPSPQQRRQRGGLFLSGETTAAPVAAPVAVHGGGDPGSVTPFRPARLSTVLLLDCRIPAPASDGSGNTTGGGKGSNGGRNSCPSAKVSVESCHV
jgi:hypothetical protein